MLKQLCTRLQFAVALCTFAISALAPTQLHAAGTPVRVAIVGLVHDHAMGLFGPLARNPTFSWWRSWNRTRR